MGIANDRGILLLVSDTIILDLPYLQLGPCVRQPTMAASYELLLYQNIGVLPRYSIESRDAKELRGQPLLALRTLHTIMIIHFYQNYFLRFVDSHIYFSN